MNIVGHFVRSASFLSFVIFHALVCNLRSFVQPVVS